MKKPQVREHTMKRDGPASTGSNQPSKRVKLSKSNDRALMLIDLMIYMALVMGVLALLAIVFHQGSTQAGSLRRNIADIERAMKAGERWRADVRGATGPIGDANGKLTIPTADGNILYEWSDSKVFRRRPGAERGEVILNEVKFTRIFRDQREHAEGWRWELELDQRQKKGKLRPLFTFLATPEKSI